MEKFNIMEKTLSDLKHKDMLNVLETSSLGYISLYNIEVTRNVMSAEKLTHYMLEKQFRFIEGDPVEYRMTDEDIRGTMIEKIWTTFGRDKILTFYVNENSTKEPVYELQALYGTKVIISSSTNALFTRGFNDIVIMGLDEMVTSLEMTKMFSSGHKDKTIYIDKMHSIIRQFWKLSKDLASDVESARDALRKMGKAYEIMYTNAYKYGIMTSGLW